MNDRWSLDCLEPDCIVFLKAIRKWSCSFILLHPEAVLPTLKYTAEMGIYNAPQMDHFFPCLFYLDSFLYISYGELVDTEGQKPCQNFSQQNIFIRQKQILYFVFESAWLSEKVSHYLSTKQVQYHFICFLKCWVLCPSILTSYVLSYKKKMPSEMQCTVLHNCVVMCWYVATCTVVAR